MIENLGTALAICLTWGERNRILLLFVFALWLTSLFVALAWPLPTADSFHTTHGQKSSSASAKQTRQGEVLEAFLDNTRWGISLKEIIERTSAGQQSAVNPVLRKMGYVGLITTFDSNEVVLLMPEGGTQRLTIGDILPDGRELVDIDENSLTLQDAQQNLEVLVLFPELSPEIQEYPAKIEDAADTLPQDRQQNQ